MNFTVLVIGSDANAYYMARCYHEAYGKKAHVLAKSPLPYTQYSNILDLFYDDSIWTEEGFLAALTKFRNRTPEEQILLISSNESYARMIAKHAETLRELGYVFNYPSVKILDSLMMKENFYRSYENSCISLPKTRYFDCKKEREMTEEMTYPIIIKPSNVIEYNHLSFAGKHKIFKAKSKEEANEILNTVIQGGYQDRLILQDFIPGDDSLLYDAVAYVSQSGKVKLLTLAQIGLQEHSKNMVGNAAVLINGYRQHGNREEIEEQMKSFLEGIGYSGFAEFDLKYDTRDNKFKVLEINARQGRSSYYITKLGFNPVKMLVEDLIEKKELSYSFPEEKVLLSFVPKGVAKRYIQNEAFLKEAMHLWKTKGAFSPVRYEKDRNFKRMLYLLKKHFRYYKEYQNGYWKEN